jgi:hypothetical protein
MKRGVLDEIEKRIDKLTPDEQLYLIEQLARKVRGSRPKRRPLRKENLAAMAADPQILAELRKIDEEFRGTEADGLEKL